LLFRDDRLCGGNGRRRWWRNHHVEAVAETDLDLAFVQIMLRDNIAARWEHKGVGIGERIVRGMTEIRIAVFRPHRPIIGDGIFDAAAKCEACASVRDGRVGARNAGEESGRIEITGVEAGYGDAAGAVK